MAFGEHGRKEPHTKDALPRALVEHASELASERFASGDKKLEKFKLSAPSGGTHGYGELRLRLPDGSEEEVNVKVYQGDGGLRFVRDMGTTDDPEIQNAFFEILKEAGIAVSSTSGFEE